MFTQASPDKHTYANPHPALSHGPPARTLQVTMSSEQARCSFSGSSQVSALHRAVLYLHRGFCSFFPAVQGSGDSVMSTGHYSSEGKAMVSP